MIKVIIHHDLLFYCNHPINTMFWPNARMRKGRLSRTRWRRRAWRLLLERNAGGKIFWKQWKSQVSFYSFFLLKLRLLSNCQNVILFLRDFYLPYRRAFCHSGLRWRRHFLLQQWWLILFLNVHDISNFDLQCSWCCWCEMLSYLEFDVICYWIEECKKSGVVGVHNNILQEINHCFVCRSSIKIDFNIKWYFK